MESPPPSVDESRRPRPRLGIAHLLIWTAATAVVLSVRGAWMQWDTFPADELLAARIGHVVTCIAYGAILTGILVLLWWRFRGGIPFPDAPGHWLLLFLVAGVLLDAAAEAAAQSLVSPRDTTVYWWHRWHIQQAVIFSGVAILSVVFLLWMRAGRGWALMFLVMLVGSLAMLGLQAGMWKGGSAARAQAFAQARPHVELASAASVVVTLAVVALVDRRRNPGRDWLHWTGVAVFVLLAGCYVVTRLRWLV